MTDAWSRRIVLVRRPAAGVVGGFGDADVVWRELIDSIDFKLILPTRDESLSAAGRAASGVFIDLGATESAALLTRDAMAAGLAPIVPAMRWGM